MAVSESPNDNVHRGPQTSISLECNDRLVILNLGQEVILHYDYTSFQMGRRRMYGKIFQIEDTKVTIRTTRAVTEIGEEIRHEGIVVIDVTNPFKEDKFLRGILPIPTNN